MREKEIFQSVTTRLDLEDIMQNEVSQMVKDKSMKYM